MEKILLLIVCSGLNANSQTHERIISDNMYIYENANDSILLKGKTLYKGGYSPGVK